MLELTKSSYFNFNAGEVHCKVKNNTTNEFKNILMRDYSMDGLMALAQHVEVLKRRNINITVTYPYFPYGRQDRITALNEPFSLKIYCDFLNSLDLYEVVVIDPHSDVTPALIKNCRVIPQWEIADRVIPKRLFEDENTLFVSPDAGAYKKVSKLMPDANRIAIGVKKRDTATGEITSTNVYSPVDIAKKSCIMVDDICDGGRTFIALADALKKVGADKIYLYVTHGIFSYGLLELKKSEISRIYTTDSFPQQTNEDFLIVKPILG